MLLPSPKRLRGHFRSFVGAVAESTASRRELSSHPPPGPPSLWSVASTKSNQSASKLLTCNLYSSFVGKEEPSGAGANEVIARLRERAELANCWRAKLLVELCPCSPNAEPVVMDAFSLVDVDAVPLGNLFLTIRPGRRTDSRTRCCY
jgi:hypothetical protein